MRTALLPTLAVLALGFSVPSQAALSIVADAATPLTISSGGASWNTITFPPSNLANVYWDANADGVFGNSPGENTGNTADTLPFTINIASGTDYLFALEGFGTAGATGSVSFTLTKTDASTEFLNLTQGTPTSFSDSTGVPWQAEFVFNNGAYGDVVFNGGAGGNGANVNDHQGVLTFTQVPEPSSVLLVGFALAACGLRRRR